MSRDGVYALRAKFSANRRTGKSDIQASFLHVPKAVSAGVKIGQIVVHCHCKIKFQTNLSLDTNQFILSAVKWWNFPHQARLNINEIPISLLSSCIPVSSGTLKPLII